MMVSLWRDKYGYNHVYCINDINTDNKWHLTSIEINDYLNKKRGQIESRKIKVDALIIYLTGHGVDKYILTSNMKGIDRSVISGKFNNKECAVLRGRPKIFIYDQCRGKHRIRHRMELSSTKNPPESAVSKEWVNEMSDMFMHYGTSNGYVSKCAKDGTGSYFTQSYDKIFTEGRYSQCTLCELATQTTAALNELKKADQPCEFVSRLRKSVIISPSD